MRRIPVSLIVSLRAANGDGVQISFNINSFNNYFRVTFPNFNVRSLILILLLFFNLLNILSFLVLNTSNVESFPRSAERESKKSKNETNRVSSLLSNNHQPKKRGGGKSHSLISSFQRSISFSKYFNFFLLWLFPFNFFEIAYSHFTNPFVSFRIQFQLANDLRE